MAATTIVNNLTVVHKGSDGMVVFGPDVCLTPTSNGPVPIPYPNTAMSTDTAQGSKNVKVDGNPIMLQGSVFSKSTGDESGSNGGVSSGVNKGKAEFINYSFDVTVEGKNVPRLGDHMLGNKGSAPNTPPSPETQPPAAAAGVDANPEIEESLHIEVIDPAGNPVKDLRYVLKRPDGSEQEGKTDASGKIDIDTTIAGVGRIVFPDVPGSSIGTINR